MKTINLKDYYTWYTQDEYVEVTDEVAAELEADKIYEKTQKRNKRRSKVLSLDVDCGMEISTKCDPQTAVEKKDQYCRLCRALNSLPETQGRRVEARYLLGKSIQEIAEADSVSDSAVFQSIEQGLQAMKKVYFDDLSNLPCQMD